MCTQMQWLMHAVSSCLKRALHACMFGMFPGRSLWPSHYVYIYACLHNVMYMSPLACMHAHVLRLLPWWLWIYRTGFDHANGNTRPINLCIQRALLSSLYSNVASICSLVACPVVRWCVCAPQTLSVPFSQCDPRRLAFCVSPRICSYKTTYKQICNHVFDAPSCTTSLLAPQAGRVGACVA